MRPIGTDGSGPARGLLDELMSGRVCLDGALEVPAPRRSGESRYERIVQPVDAVEAGMAPTGRLADR